MGERYTGEELAEWSGGEWVPTAPAAIGGVSKDTRSISAGDLYVALKGDNFDGHDFVSDSAKKDACGAVVASEQLSFVRDQIKGKEFPLLVVENTGKALRDMAKGYRDRIDPQMIGITGSAGKSTVKEMVLQILARDHAVAGTMGNWNNSIGLPMSLLAMDPGIEKGVFEIATNHLGEIAALASVLVPDGGVITNVGPAHLGYFDSVDAIADEKSSLLACLPDDGYAVLNLDDDYFDRCRTAAECRVITVSKEAESDYNYVQIGTTGKILVKENISEEEMLYKPVVPGEHNAMNALMAIAVARNEGVGWDCIKDTLEKYAPLPMRWEVKDALSVKMINDAYNANPLSMRASINAFERMPVTGGRWLVLSGMLELGSHEDSAHVSLGEYIGDGKWEGVVLIGEHGRMIARGIETTGCDMGNVFLCKDNREASTVLHRELREGDTVLFKASRGMRLEEIIDSFENNA